MTESKEEKLIKIVQYVDECLSLNNAETEIAFLALLSLVCTMCKTDGMPKKIFDEYVNLVWANILITK